MQLNPRGVSLPCTPLGFNCPRRCHCDQLFGLSYITNEKSHTQNNILINFENQVRLHKLNEKHPRDAHVPRFPDLETINTAPAYLCDQLSGLVGGGVTRSVTPPITLVFLYVAVCAPHEL
jgi:hypothetical protein